jgi:hypothetical protein
MLVKRDHVFKVIFLILDSMTDRPHETSSGHQQSVWIRLEGASQAGQHDDGVIPSHSTRLTYVRGPVVLLTRILFGTDPRCLRLFLTASFHQSSTRAVRKFLRTIPHEGRMSIRMHLPMAAAARRRREFSFEMWMEESARRVMCTTRQAISAVSRLGAPDRGPRRPISAIVNNILGMGKWCPGKDSNLHGR